MVEKVLQLHREKTIFWSLLGILVISAFFYMYFINTTVHNIVVRQNLESEASTLTLALGNQEFQYIKARNSVTLQLAYSLGFKDVREKSFVVQKPLPQVSYLVR